VPHNALILAAICYHCVKLYVSMSQFLVWIYSGLHYFWP